MPKSGNPIFAFLDKVFLWLPGDNSPGFPAVAVALARQAVLPFALGMIPILILGTLGGKFSQLMDPAAHKEASVYVAMPMIGCIGLAQELNRYAFTRRADRLVRSLVIITVVEIAFGLLFNHARLYTMSWQAAEQLLASVALFFGLKARKYAGPIVFLIVVGHIAVDLTAPRFFTPPQATSSRSTLVAAASISPPKVGDMQSWAKIYPGSIVTNAKTTTLLGLTDWEIDYTTKASPEQIQTFYQSTANAEGFTDTETFAGLHYFTQPSTRNDFYFRATPSPTGTDVDFSARNFTQK